MPHQEEIQPPQPLHPKPRIPFTQKVWVRSSEQSQPAEWLASNLSESGIFVQTTRPPEVGSRVKLQFLLPDTTATIEAIAEVVWVKAFEPINIDGVLPGMGAKFVQLGPRASEQLKTYLEIKIPVRPQPSRQSRPEAQQVERMAFEKPLALQIKGEAETVFGYSVHIDADGLKFRTDDIPKGSMLNRLAQGKSDRALRGCIAVPVDVELDPELDGVETTSPGEAKLKLRFLELRADLLQGLGSLSARTLQKSAPEEATGKRPTPLSLAKGRNDSPTLGWQFVLTIGLGIALGIVLGIALGLRLH